MILESHPIEKISSEATFYSLNGENSFENQNILYEGLTGISSIYEKNLKKNKNLYTVTKEGTYHILLNNNLAVIINNKAYTFDESLLKGKENIEKNIEPYDLLTFELNENDKIELIYNEKQMKIEKEKIPEVPYIYYYNEEKQSTNKVNTEKE